MNRKWMWLWLICLLFMCTGCQVSKKTYTLTLTGRAEESGVLSFLGYEINVYPDPADNSCGDCADQPVHLYAGAAAAEAIEAIAEVIVRADDLWAVKEYTADTIVLEEKQAGTAKELPAPSAPAGLYLEDSEGVRTAAAETASGRDSGSAAESPARIAAIYGPSYEALVLLGQEDNIVLCADVQKDNFPWATKVFRQIAGLPCLENVHAFVSTEELLRYQPDFVVSFSRPAEKKQLEEAGLAFLAGRSTQTLAENKENLMLLAEALGGDAPARAEKYAEYFDEKLLYVTERVQSIPAGERPGVYYAGIDVLTTYGRYSDLPELIEAAGGIPVTADVDGGNHIQIDFEQLAAWNPDYIFLDHGGVSGGKTTEELLAEIYRDSRYQSLQAIKSDQIYLSPSGVFYWDMGLQKILLLLNMAQILHPDQFSDLDMAQEVQTFYQEFFNYSLTREEAVKILARQDP